MSSEPRRTTERQRTAVVHYNGVSYTRNLSMCRRALTERQVEGKYLGGLVLRTYGHLLPGVDREAADRLGEVVKRRVRGERK
jgi:hypothetical protein